MRGKVKMGRLQVRCVRRKREGVEVVELRVEVWRGRGKLELVGGGRGQGEIEWVAHPWVLCGQSIHERRSNTDDRHGSGEIPQEGR